MNKNKSGYWAACIPWALVLWAFAFLSGSTREVEMFGYMWRWTSLLIYAGFGLLVFSCTFGTIALVANRVNQNKALQQGQPTP